MIRLAAPLIFVGFLNGCQGDETVRAYGAADKQWRLVDLNDTAFSASATLTFPETGRVTGQGPCNGFSATMTVPYPWFELGPIAATQRACPELDAETVYFSALSAATLSEVLGDTMILSNTEGLSMVFKAGG